MSFSISSGSTKQRQTTLLVNKLSFADEGEQDDIPTSPSSMSTSTNKRSSLDAGLAPYSPRFSPPTAHQHLPAEVHWSRREDPTNDQRCVGPLHVGVGCFPGDTNTNTPYIAAMPLDLQDAQGTHVPAPVPVTMAAVFKDATRTTADTFPAMAQLKSALAQDPMLRSPWYVPA